MWKPSRPSLPSPFFKRLCRLLSLAFFVALTALILLTVSSRLGYLNCVGVAVILSNSMEPTLRCGDAVLYLNVGYDVGDVVVYCASPSHCVVHRVVGFVVLNTVSGHRTMVVTKGDGVELPDSPVDPSWVRGRVVLTVPREVWMPILVPAMALVLLRTSKIPVVGPSYLMLLLTGLSSILAVYATTPSPIKCESVEPPIMNLAGAYFEPEMCAVRVRYVGELSITAVSVRVNSTPASMILASERELLVRPSPLQLKEAFELGRPLIVEVEAELNHVGRMRGEYAVIVGGLNPELSVADGALIVGNPNGFPVTLNVSIRYYDGASWAWSNRTYLLEGRSHLVVEPPSSPGPAYVYAYWLRGGEVRWIGLPLRGR